MESYPRHSKSMLAWDLTCFFLLRLRSLFQTLLSGPFTPAEMAQILQNSRMVALGKNWQRDGLGCLAQQQWSLGRAYLHPSHLFFLKG